MEQLSGKYKGEDGKRGYRTNQVYTITVATTANMGRAIIIHSPQFFPYVSLQDFLNDWDIISKPVS